MFFVWICVASIALTAIFSAFQRSRSVSDVASFVEEQARRWNAGSDQSEISPAERTHSSLLMAEMIRFDHSMTNSIQSRTLQYFDVTQNLAPIQRAIGSVSGVLRPATGWCLLLGLMITLFNLQRAVGDLSGAFLDLSKVPQHIGSANETRVSSRAREQNVTDRMAGMTSMASRAFQTSLGFISIALFCGVTSTFLERGARKWAFKFEGNAVVFYQNSLPSQLPVTEGKVAQLLVDSMSGMGEVVEELRSAAGAFANLQPLVTAMSRATDSIESAMRQLPEDLRSSMSNITGELVSQLNETLGESTEYTKKILAIYAEQELRVKGLHSIINSLQSSLAEIRSTHKILEELPANVAKLSESAAMMSLSTQEFSLKVRDLPSEAVAEACTLIRDSNALLRRSADKTDSIYEVLLRTDVSPVAKHSEATA